MNKYMSLDEELQRIKEMHDKALLIENDIRQPAPCRCGKPEGNKEIITSGDVNPDVSDEEIDEIIRKQDDGYNLYSHEGKKLGSHSSKEDAEQQERAIWANK